MKPAILHIGLPKTGTSAIQSWLNTNEAELAHAGWAYPAEFHAGVDGLNLLSVTMCIPSEKRLPTQTEAAERFTDWLDEIGDTGLIYSSEHLSRRAMSIGPFSQFLTLLRDKGFAPHVVLVLRNPIDFLNSAFNQLQKTLKGVHLRQQIHEIVSAKQYRWFRVLDGLNALSCPYSIGVFPPPGGSKNLIPEFLRLTQLDAGFDRPIEQEVGGENSGIGRIGLVAATHLIGAYWDRTQNERSQISQILTEHLSHLNEPPVRVYNKAQLKKMEAALQPAMDQIRPLISEEEFARLSVCKSATYKKGPATFADLTPQEQAELKRVLADVGQSLDQSPHFDALGIKGAAIHEHDLGDSVVRSPYVVKADALHRQRIAG